MFFEEELRRGRSVGQLAVCSSPRAEIYPLLHSLEIPLAVLWSALEAPAQEGCGLVGARPGEGAHFGMGPCRGLLLSEIVSPGLITSRLEGGVVPEAMLTLSTQEAGWQHAPRSVACS